MTDIQGEAEGTSAHDDWEREPDPSDSLRTFGAVVQALREHAGYTRVEFGELVRFSKHTVESVELGRRMPDVAFVERAEELLGNTGALRRAAMYLSRGEPGLAAWFRQWARLERRATILCTYECRLVPGLLQSRSYAKTVFANLLPPPSDEQVDAWLTARMDRRKLIHERPNTEFSFIIEEHVLRRRLGGDDVTHGQLELLLELAELRNVHIQIMPTNIEIHAALDGPIAIMELPDGKRLAYSEGQNNGRLISDPKEAATLHQRYATLRSQALNTLDSVGLMNRIRGAQ
ncbi:helix-turn-helix domain-containing protein [Streptomyces sp. NPDC058953]|uniref:helix-turn-helix domain-containing protein n=1 Tax=unclassified Streptomyces TaxID=2593676 RepID=UPI0036776381